MDKMILGGENMGVKSIANTSKSLSNEMEMAR